MAIRGILFGMALLANMIFGQGNIGGIPKISVPPPVPIHKVPAEYTEEAREAKIEGTVFINLTIDENGIPVDLKVLRSLDKGLDEKAIQALRQWRFKPELRDGKPASSTANIGIIFRLPN